MGRWRLQQNRMGRGEDDALEHDARCSLARCSMISQPVQARKDCQSKYAPGAVDHSQQYTVTERSHTLLSVSQCVLTLLSEASTPVSSRRTTQTTSVPAWLRQTYLSASMKSMALVDSNIKTTATKLAENTQERPKKAELKSALRHCRKPNNNILVANSNQHSYTRALLIHIVG